MRKKISVIVLSIMLVSILFTGCGENENIADDVTSKTTQVIENGIEENSEKEVATTEQAEMYSDSNNETISDTENMTTNKDVKDETPMATDTTEKVTTSKENIETTSKKQNVTSTEETTTAKKETETTSKKETTAEKTTEPETTVHTHNYSSKVTKQATCTEKGIKTFTCSCGNSYTEDIVKTEHTASDWIVTKEATCSASGTKVKNCITCGTQVASETIASNSSHNYVWVTNGDTRTMTCTGCNNTSITEYKFGDAWGYYDDAPAEELWYWINAQRNATRINTYDDWGNVIDTITVASLNKNDELYVKAKTRAIEAAINFDHAGEQHECLAWGYGTAVAVYEAWCYSPSHIRAMVDSAYSIGGVAWFWYDSDNSGMNLTPIAVLELGY